MDPLEKMQLFLKTHHYEQSRCACFGLEKGQSPFVTISRETGAGGNTLAQVLRRRFDGEPGDFFQGWQICNQQICGRLIEEPQYSGAMQKLLSLEYRSQLQDMLEEIITGDVSQDLIVKKMFEMIRAFATYGKMILVGRAGVNLTRDLPLGIHVRLVAPQASRIRRIMQDQSLDEKKARTLVLEQDKGRRDLVKTYFNQDITDPLAYDAVFNTDRTGFEEIADFIISRIRAKQPACH